MNGPDTEAGMLSELRDLARHMEWADAVVWNAVLALPASRTDALTRERLYHVHTVQQVYLQMWRGEPRRVREVSSFGTLEEIRDWGREVHGAIAEFLDGLREEDLSRPVEFPWAAQLAERFGVARPATLAETVLQATSHSTYHRGQVNAHLRQLGGEPPLTDFIAWIWSGRPAPEWEPAAVG